MNIPKALEILATIQEQLVPGASQDELNAIKLGAEALKKLQCLRQMPLVSPSAPLPGETAD